MISRDSAARYADLADRTLAAALSEEDRAEARGLDPFERRTCHTHRRWLHHCIASPVHVVVVTGHRWCRDCACPAAVVVDELAGDVRMYCPSCGRMPDGPANRQVLRACRASLASARCFRLRGPASPAA
ncbi:hypothetical protein FPZ12_041205 [Amycolatopsis acidicola]|uniref:Transposase n=1 Tax=Amycolatopsis acidicola TaxID=2596893 RepID=A0A5N0UL37_9PSEU|nr:hypothetical protein [Amycolatopsis acidicola]KAA9150412.1 hypothetical protein FPZ12_041205 [Amycolatopsis acidicola]